MSARSSDAYVFVSPWSVVHSIRMLFLVLVWFLFIRKDECMHSEIILLIIHDARLNVDVLNMFAINNMFACTFFLREYDRTPATFVWILCPYYIMIIVCYVHYATLLKCKLNWFKFNARATAFCLHIRENYMDKKGKCCILNSITKQKKNLVCSSKNASKYFKTTGTNRIGSNSGLIAVARGQ